MMVDGGIRRGSDIAKAICLGARAVLIGRAYMYGLGAAGEAGIARAIEILRADLERTMALLGCKSIAELNRSYVDIPASWAVLQKVEARAFRLAKKPLRLCGFRAAEKVPACHSQGGFCLPTAQTADPSLRPAPAKTAGNTKPRGTSLGMTARVFFRSPFGCGRTIYAPRVAEFRAM